MNLSPSAKVVQQALDGFGMRLQVVELPASTRTAVEAARAIGCGVEQIVKSLVFKGSRSGKPILILASGANRVDEKAAGEIIGEPLGKADANFVRQRTGFAIGGVPPLGHSERLQTFIDEDLLLYDEVWAAAGTPNAVFRLTPADLLLATQGRVISIK